MLCEQDPVLLQPKTVTCLDRPGKLIETFILVLEIHHLSIAQAPRGAAFNQAVQQSTWAPVCREKGIRPEGPQGLSTDTLGSGLEMTSQMMFVPAAEAWAPVSVWSGRTLEYPQD